VRTQRLDPLLGAAQPGGSDQLHRAGDLLDVLDRVDAVSNVALREGHLLLGDPRLCRSSRLLLLGFGLLLLLLAIVAARRPVLAGPAWIVAAVVDRVTLLVEVKAEVLGELIDGLLNLTLGVVAPVA